MIVCSKRAYLNILTQLMDATTLINANYYIADQTLRGTEMHVADQMNIDEDGGYVLQHVSRPTLNPFHIHYGDGSLSPTALMSELLYEDNTSIGIEQRFINHLMKEDTLANVYTYLYGDKSRGNGLRIFMFASDSNVYLLHVVCEYISRVFGEDIKFIDKIYRNDIKGFVNYTGNKANAAMMIKRIRDYKLMKDISDIAANYQYGYGSIENLEVYFETFDIDALFYIYEKLFPHEPLTPGRYEKERMVHIITRKIAQQCPQKVSNNLSVELENILKMYGGVSDEEIESSLYS